MKKLLLVILIITLPLIAFFQYKNYKRFHPPVAYGYVVSENVDVNYHNYSLVEEYYSKAVEIGSFARLQWRNYEIDVRFPDIDSQEELNAAAKYENTLARIKLIEQKLIASAEYKGEGFNNMEIEMIESGVPSDIVRWVDEDANILQVALGDRGQAVWVVQEKLIEKGYDHNLDGVFGLDTQNAIISFQTDNTLYPSGSLDEATFKKLFVK